MTSFYPALSISSDSSVNLGVCKKGVLGANPLAFVSCRLHTSFYSHAALNPKSCATSRGGFSTPTASALISRQGRAYRSTLSAVTSRMALRLSGVRNNLEKLSPRYVSQASRVGLFLCSQVRFSCFGFSYE